MTVIGAIAGTNWDTDFEMTQQPEGTWYTTEPIELKKGDEFKVRMGKSWDVNFGADNKVNGPNVVVEEDGWYFVKVVVNAGLTEGVISLEKNSPSTGWTVIGAIAGANWDKDFDMELQADGTYKSVDAFDLNAGDEFKVRQGQNWDNSWGNGTDNFKVETAGKFYVVFNPTTTEVSLSAE